MISEGNNGVVGIWAYVGPLVGLVVGGLLQSRLARNQWQRDNVKEECRELLKALGDAYYSLYRWKTSDSTDNTVLADLQAKYREVEITWLQTFHSRLFIHSKIRASGLSEKWRASVVAYYETGDTVELGRKYNECQALIVKIGVDDSA